MTLSGARIDGQLFCGGGRFRNAEGMALNAQSARLTGSMFLSDRFVSEGEVSMSGARIGGHLVCSGGSFHNAGGHALTAHRMRVEDSFFWRGASVPEGVVDLASAHVGDLVDDLKSWPEGEGKLILDGFTYDRISGGAPTDANSRLKWLKRGTVWKGEFYPQPYTQLAKVLRGMGHDRAAREVLVERGRLTSESDWRRAHKALDGNWRPGLASVGADGRRVTKLMSKWVVGYGYKPFRSLWWLFGLWGIAAYLAANAWHFGAMVPNSDVILTSPGWQAVAARGDAAAAWVRDDGAGRDWETFSALAWGFDVVVPILSVGQTEAWAPSPARGGWGHAVWWGRWGLSVAGWIVAALAAAAVTGIIRREED